MFRCPRPAPVLLGLLCLIPLAAAGAPAGAPARPAAVDTTTLRPLPESGGGAPVPQAPAIAPDGEGRGEREMVLIHGLGSSADVWTPMVATLSRSYRVRLYELPGHGRTAPVPHLTIESAAADLGRYLKANDIVQPVLVGHAMGGLIAMRYAFDHPTEIKRLILIDAAPKQLASPEQKARVADQLLTDYDRFVAETYARMSPDPAITRRVVDQALKTDRPSFTSLLMSSFTFDLTEELPRQAVPILLIGSGLLLPTDKNVPAQLDALGYTNARTVSFKRVERTGHFVMLEQPDYLASIILAWCDLN
ncbi:MAG: alpha/beta fold hydrolase [Candidatus Krumholzibacteriia bacterium]